MFRSALIRSTRSVSRTFSTSTRAMAAGDLGSGTSRSGGEKAGDAFTKREKAAEEQWIRREEKEKLLQLKEKLMKQKEHIEELSKNIDEMVKNSGGEHN